MLADQRHPCPRRVVEGVPRQEERQVEHVPDRLHSFPHLITWGCKCLSFMFSLRHTRFDGLVGRMSALSRPLSVGQGSSLIFFSSIKTLIRNNLEGQDNSVRENTGNLVILSNYVILGCLPIFEDQFKTLFKTFKDQLFWNLRAVCTMNDEQVLGNGASTATREIR